MAYWNGEKTIYLEPKVSKNYPNWLKLDCGCCSGIEWGGESPVECRTCGGLGVIYKHIKSGVLAHYPGGSFCGKEPPGDLIKQEER